MTLLFQLEIYRTQFNRREMNWKAFQVRRTCLSVQQKQKILTIIRSISEDSSTITRTDMNSHSPLLSGKLELFGLNKICSCASHALHNVAATTAAACRPGFFLSCLRLKSKISLIVRFCFIFRSLAYHGKRTATVRENNAKTAKMSICVCQKRNLNIENLCEWKNDKIFFKF